MTRGTPAPKRGAYERPQVLRLSVPDEARAACAVSGMDVVSDCALNGMSASVTCRTGWGAPSCTTGRST